MQSNPVEVEAEICMCHTLHHPMVKSTLKKALHGGLPAPQPVHLPLVQYSVHSFCKPGREAKAQRR
jgi:hypothetical protein